MSAHRDTFAHDNLPPRAGWPAFEHGALDYPQILNAAAELTDRMVERGFGDRTALIGHGRLRTYKELADWTSRLARALTDDLGLVPGNRVLIRSANNPAMVACWLAAVKAGAIVVNTVPSLMADDLAAVIDKAEIRFALCDTRLMGEMVSAAKGSRFLKTVIGFDGTANFDAELDRLALAKPVRFDPVPTSRDDIAIIAFSTGTTGEPKAAMHAHRDLLAVADTFARDVLAMNADDVVVGTPPLAYTFGLGALVLFPLRFGAASVLLEEANAAELLGEVRSYKATIAFASPAIVQRLTALKPTRDDLASLRVLVSAGDALPAKTFAAWRDATGIPLIDGLGGTELLHVVLSNRIGDAVQAGLPVPGYTLRVVDAGGTPLAAGVTGLLAVRGPTGARLLRDERQARLVSDGWTIPGDMAVEEDGRFRFVARQDDLILVDGEPVAAPLVEDALRSHASVAECAVLGVSGQTGGETVKAFVVPAPGESGSAALVKALQEHVRGIAGAASVPRSIRFVDALPRTATGKVKRVDLRRKP